MVLVPALLALFAAGAVLAKDTTARERRLQLMSRVTNWGYQLQRLDPPLLAKSPFDLLVIDHAPDRVESVELMFRRRDIEALKHKSDGGRRLVLAYLSIGEAERYRFYWNEAWVTSGNCPAWLGPVNPQWVGNYPVEFWQPQWQSLIFGQSESYVDRVLAAGFDGLYLDRADVYEQFRSHPAAKADMTAFLTHLIDHARLINPEAIVVLQNAEELARNHALRVRLDGIAKESLYFDADQGERPIATVEKAAVRADLKRVQKAGAKVMVVEYVDDAVKATVARKQAERDGFLIHFTERTLSTLNERGADGLVPRAAISAAAPSSSPQPVRAGPCG